MISIMITTFCSEFSFMAQKCSVVSFINLRLFHQPIPSGYSTRRFTVYPLHTYIFKSYPSLLVPQIHVPPISKSGSTSVPKSLSSKNRLPTNSSGKYVCRTRPSL